MRATRPLLWLGTNEVQIGLGAQATVITDLEPSETNLLIDLSDGKFPLESDLRRRGVNTKRWRALESQARAAQAPPPPLPPLSLRPIPLDSHPLTRLVVASLQTLTADGALVTPTVPRRSSADRRASAVPPSTLAVLTDWYVTDPFRTRPLMRADHPFLPLVIDDDGITANPPVFPGMTACPRCLELARTDADPRWPAIAAQLRVQPRGAADPTLMRLAAAAATLGIGLEAEWGAGWRVEASGIARFTVNLHEACGCQAPGVAR